ncbi:hypothetical protein LJC15_05330 [Desulfovibrio sp. OttesenSCG-928-G11]|nr:hypothetical protein [Desulfovibrio sp. OttesenSCG-928-G11]
MHEFLTHYTGLASTSLLAPCRRLRYERAMPPAFYIRPAVRLLICFLTALSLLWTVRSLAMGSAPERHAVGMRTFGVWEAAAGERLDFAVWYPSRVHGDESELEGWIVEVGKRGRIDKGFFPVLLMSHDTGTGRFANNDLAAALAAGGMVVIAPTHTGDSQISGSAMYSAQLMRDRPRHLLRALETLLASADFAPHIDESRIGLLGVGFGSITALQLAGARPDFHALEGYCLDAPEGDAFCGPWSAAQFARLPAALAGLEEDEGGSVLTPSLAMYAPKLVSVPVLRAEGPEEAEAPVEAKKNFWQRLFASNKSAREEDPARVQSGNATAQAEKNAAEAEAGETANFPLLLDFQGGSKFGGTDSGAPFVLIALSDSPQYRVPVADSQAGNPASPEPETKKSAQPHVYRRPASVRQIRGIAVLTPAGGMLFSREALAGVQIPVAVVEAAADVLYPPKSHSQPYVTGLPTLPLTLNLEGADHFSLFARCSRDTLKTLGEICGRLPQDARQELADKRNAFLVPFFQSVLGAPLPEPRSSGLAAEPSPQ